MQRATEYASEILAVSATSFVLSWEWEGDAAGPEVHGPYLDLDVVGERGLAAAFWSATPFKEADREVAMKATEEWCTGVSGSSPGALWLVTPPTVGSRHGSVANTRLKAHGRELTRLAERIGARTIPFNDMCRSALRDQKREPTRPSFSDLSGVLTPHGSYLLALAILETLSLP